MKAKISKDIYNRNLLKLQRETGQLDDRLMHRGLQNFAGLLILADIIGDLDFVPWSFEESRAAIFWAARNWTKNVEFCLPRPAEHLLTKIERLVSATKPSHQEAIPANSGAHPALAGSFNPLSFLLGICPCQSQLAAHAWRPVSTD